MNQNINNNNSIKPQVDCQRTSKNSYIEADNLLKQIIIINQQKVGVEPNEKQQYQKTQICRYCQKNYLKSEVKYKITLKMLIEMDRYLLHLGRNYKWLERSDISNADLHCLYQEHKVCQRWLYIEIQGLMEIQNKLTVKFGMNLQKTPKQLIQSFTDWRQLERQSKNQQIHQLSTGIPQIIELGLNRHIVTKDNCPIRTDEVINKMLRYRVIMYFKQFDQIDILKPNHNYYIQYNFLGVKHKIKLDTYKFMNRIIPIQKMRMFYFFSHSHQDLITYANNNQNLVLHLVIQNRFKGQRRNIGWLNLSIKEYLNCPNSKKDFYKLFHVEDVPYGWGLQGSIGIISSKDYVNTSRIVFSTDDKLIYLPNHNYYYCQPLPEDWLQRIQLKLKVQDSSKAKTKINHVSHRNTIEPKSIAKQVQPQTKIKIRNSQSMKQMLSKQILNYQSRIKRR